MNVVKANTIVKHVNSANNYEEVEDSYYWDKKGDKQVVMVFKPVHILYYYDYNCS